MSVERSGIAALDAILSTPAARHRGLTIDEAAQIARAVLPACPHCNGEPRTFAALCMTCASGCHHDGNHLARELKEAGL